MMVKVDRRRQRARRALKAVKRIATYRRSYGLPNSYETMPGSMAVRIAKAALRSPEVRDGD